MVLSNELNRIKQAFDKVKADNIYLSQRIDDLERSRDELVKLVLSKRAQESPIVVNEPKQKIFIGNKKSMKVHNQDCPYSKKITGENREFFDDITDALKKKYIRCSCVSE